MSVFYSGVSEKYNAKKAYCYKHNAYWKASNDRQGCFPNPMIICSWSYIYLLFEIEMKKGWNYDITMSRPGLRVRDSQLTKYQPQRKTVFGKSEIAVMTGVITSDCAVPYLDASYYAIILCSLLFVETGFTLSFQNSALFILTHEPVFAFQYFYYKSSFSIYTNCNLRARRRYLWLLTAILPRPGFIGGGPHPHIPR